MNYCSDYSGGCGMMDITTLNQAQKEAVLSTEGPLLVLAGAGSGKTRVLTYRIAYLIVDNNISPYNILALTFTNKAAREMMERTQALIEGSAQDMWVTTFHSFCARLLRIEIHNLGRERGFTIYDETEKKTIITDIMKRMEISEDYLPKKNVMYAISDAKNHSLNPIEILSQDPQFGHELVEIYKAYQAAMLIANALDFDDLILTAIQLFRECPEVLDKYRRKFRYILIDEYQDTNMPQYELIRMLASEHRNICVVGDDDQSIYGWRGADIRNILEFEKDFPGAKVIRLEQNYRSTGSILKAANAVIANNENRKGKNLWTDSGDGEQITYYPARDERDESNYLAATVAREVRNGAKYSDFAVLYRTNAQSRIIEATLLSYGIPHRVYGGVRFFERMEVKDVMAYLRLLVNPDDDAAFMRIVNVPKRNIGDVTVTSLRNVAQENNVSLMAALRKPDISMQLNSKTYAKFTDFLALMDELEKIRKTELPSTLAEQVIKLSGYVEHLSKNEDDFDSRIENLDELIGSIVEVEGDTDDETDPLALFLENAALVSDIDGMNDEDNSVGLMTLHSAKGLEFNTVFIAGMEDDLFPSSRSVMEPDKMEEERRLCYVGITRARRKLYLLGAQCRRLYNRTNWHRPSRFISEIPDELLINEGKPAIKPAAEDSWSAKPAPKPTPAFGRGVFQPPVPKLNTDTSAFRVGARVEHDKFGQGVITQVAGSGKGMLVTIDFDDGQTKKIAAQFAPLKAID